MAKSKVKCKSERAARRPFYLYPDHKLSKLQGSQGKPSYGLSNLSQVTEKK